MDTRQEARVDCQAAPVTKDTALSGGPSVEAKHGPGSFAWLASVSQKALHPLLYSGSRLAVNLGPVLLIPVALRLASPPEANVLLVLITLVTFLSNILSAWIEQVLYRFPLDGVRVRIRRAVIAECIAVAILVPSLVWLGGEMLFGTKTSEVLVPAMILMIGTDVLFRAGIAEIQMVSTDRVFVSHNLRRFGTELLAGIAGIVTTRSATAVAACIAAARLLTLAPVLRDSSLFRQMPGADTAAGERWLVYGFSMSLWFALLQLLQSVPQFLSILYQDVIANTAFLSAFRLFLQTGLLAGAFLLLYIHPKLLRCFQELGYGNFLNLWNRWFPYFAATIILFSLGCALVYPWLSRAFLTERYAGHSAAIFYTLPGVVAFAMANYVQKLMEVEKQVRFMAIYLFVALLLFIGIFYGVKHNGFRTGNFPLLVSLDLTLSFVVYLTLVAGHSLKALTGVSAGVIRARRSLTFTLMASVIAVACTATALLWRYGF